MEGTDAGSFGGDPCGDAMAWTSGQGNSTAHTSPSERGGPPVLGYDLLWAAQWRGPVPAALSPPAGAARGGSVLTAGRFGPWRSGLLRRQSGSVLFTFKGVI